MMRSAHEDAKREPGPDGSMVSPSMPGSSKHPRLPLLQLRQGCLCFDESQGVPAGHATSGPQLDKRRRVDRN
jgi:hypothetical protein